MWTLIAANLRYRAGVVVYAFVIAALIATAINVVFPPLGLAPPPDDRFRLVYFYPVLILFSSVAVGFGSMMGDQRERRLVCHVVLPRTRMQIGLARVLTPTLHVLIGLAVAEILMLTIVRLEGKPAEGWRFLFLAFFGGQFIALLQLPLMVVEFQNAAEHSRLMRVLFVLGVLGVMSVVLIRALSHYVPFDPRVVEAIRSLGTFDPETIATNLVVYAFAVLASVANVALFLRRRALLV